MEKFVDLGTPLQLMINNGSAIGRDSGGRVVVYTVIKGGNDSTVFAVVDALTAEVLSTIDMPGVSGAWPILVSKKGVVYIGTYDNGRLYKYDPDRSSLTDLGQLGEETFVFCLAEGYDGTIYAGTYPNAAIYAYKPSSNRVDHVCRVHPDEKYVDSLAYDPTRHALYAGLGRKTARLVRVDLSTGERHELLEKLLPGSDASYSSAFCMGYGLGKLMIRLSKPDHLLIVDTATETVEFYDPGSGIGLGSKTVAVKPGDDRHLYFGGNPLRSYNIATRSFSEEMRDAALKAFQFQDAKFVHLDDAEWHGLTLILSGESGQIMLYDPASGKEKRMRIARAGTPVSIRCLHGAPDGRVYIGGYMRGFACYDMETGSFTDTLDFGQAESIASFRGRVYAGIYGNAGLCEHDPGQQWGVRHPRKLWDLMRHGQDRPFAIVGAEKLNKLFVGTVPDTHSLQGALAIYDLETGEVRVFPNIVRNQGVVSLLYKNGLLYGGTTIYGGLGTSGPTESEGKLFAFDPATNEKRFELVPAAGCRTVSGLLEGPDGLIWGVAEDQVFKFDPISRKIVFRKGCLKRNDTNDTVWADADLVIGQDGFVYGTNAKGQFFRIIPETMEWELLAEGFRYLIKTTNGHLYMSGGSNLWSYVPEGIPPR